MPPNNQQCALVVGASSGYGLACALALRQAGMRVLGASRRELPGADAWIPCDVTDDAAVEHAMNLVRAETRGKLAAVVYSAGVAIGNSHVAHGNPDSWRTVFETNVLGLMRIARLAKPMLENCEGRAPAFVHIGSIAFQFTYEGGVDYCASKAAANSVMRGLRLEWLGTGIRVVTVEPGLGRTNFQLTRYAGDEDRARKHYEGITQLEPMDVASAVLYAVQAPSRVNVDEIIIKPTDQATHGKVHRH